MKKNNSFHPLLSMVKEVIYEPNGLTFANMVIDRESADYGACTFEISDKKVVFRVAKVTPTKIGQFVTLWKRVNGSPIMPYDLSDPFDVVMVTGTKENRCGQFIFPKDVLVRQDYISKDGKGGKRAMRVYPPWDAPDNKQAQRTQSWQLPYFVELVPTFNIEKIKYYFS